MQPGEWTLKIAFRGILNDKLHGFYRSQYQDASGKTHVAATTQFESTDARRAFPCWDEPELKASYKVTLVVDENLAAISNGGQESERKLPGGKKEVVFKETIVMSTYLVAFIVGEFDATAPVDAGTPLRVVHVPGKESLTSWAQADRRVLAEIFRRLLRPQVSRRQARPDRDSRLRVGRDGKPRRDHVSRNRAAG